jgi:hypothetical protein
MGKSARARSGGGLHLQTLWSGEMTFIYWIIAIVAWFVAYMIGFNRGYERAYDSGEQHGRRLGWYDGFNECSKIHEVKK